MQNCLSNSTEIHLTVLISSCDYRHSKEQKMNFFHINFISDKSLKGLQDIIIIEKIITKKY